MTYRTLLAHLPNGSVVLDVLEIASQLAQQNSTHLIGLYVKVSVQIYASDVLMPMESVQCFEEKQTKRASTIRPQIEEKSRKHLRYDCVESIRRIRTGITSEVSQKSWRDHLHDTRNHRV